MTEEEATALGKRLSACRHFRPMPGLKDMQGRTWDDSLLWRWNPEVDVPDLRQPASMGILLACVREAWRNPDDIVLNGTPDQWAHTFVAALESMP